MTALFFCCLVACIFAGVAMMEAEPGPGRVRFGTGLLGWLTSGNWPAKLGGALLIVGVGALLRYALLRVEVPPEVKLWSGGLISAGLFLIAHFVRTRFGRREIAIALAGAAFGVAYLTSYSAYAFFHYLESTAGLIALAVVAIGAGSYSVLRNALSLALLAMFGAYLAPAFALDQPTILTVYGYYIAISQLILVMVALRGWRPLIHLSFVFTLAGGIFFAWTAGFFAPEHFASMQPLVLILVAIHLAMPLAEQRSKQSKWTARFDKAYSIALPLAGGILMWTLAPSSSALSMSIAMLGGIWAVATLAIRGFKLQGALAHGAIAVALLSLAAYLKTPEWPWFLIGQAVSAAVLVVATRTTIPRKFHDVASAGVLVFGALFIALSLSTPTIGLPFLNTGIGERLLSGALMLIAMIAGRRLDHPLSKFFGWIGAAILVNTTALELYRAEIASWPLIIHGALVTGAIGMAIASSRRIVPKYWTTAMLFALALSSASVAVTAHGLYLCIMVFATPIALLALGLRSAEHDDGISNVDRILALAMTPIVTWMWATPFVYLLGDSSGYGPLVFAAAAALLSLNAARLRKTVSTEWIEWVQRFYALGFGVTLGVTTLLAIRIGVLPIALDVLCLAGLAQLTFLAEKDHRSAQSLYTMTAIGAALVVQAMLLRALGPGGHMTVLDVFELKLPAVISLFWSALGASLTIVARRVKSRSLWSVGALVLVACAAKLILLDFGSLGELANILAVIASGAVFLLVSWLAPVPPKEEADEEPELAKSES